MSGWTAKRFWTDTTVETEENGFSVRLDGRAVKTPAKTALIVPTRAMAEAIEAEWQAQGEKIDPLTMPVTRSANAALDKVTPQKSEVANLIAAYGETDLLCYRADGPTGLVARQAEAWDSLLDWAEQALGARLAQTVGVIPVEQPPASVARLREHVGALTPFELTALHDLVGMSGSLIIGFAALHGWADPDELWRRSRIDETWQEEQWGVDVEASELADRKKTDFVHALRFYRLAGESV